jgi:hypothetical protein
MARTVMRRVLRGTVWAVKGLLALVALAALVAWPWSYGHPGKLTVTRWTVGAERVDLRGWYGGWGEGRVGMGRGGGTFSGKDLNWGRDWAASDGPGWVWKVWAGLTFWHPMEGDNAWGPFRWEAFEDAPAAPGFVAHRRELTLPCWLLALVAGAWPATSAAVLARRRRRVRRLARDGRCRRCGYDLRATPEAAGAGGRLMAVCPECGDETRGGKR